MGSGRGASMREGPLAALFRKTETEGIEDQRPQQPPAERPVPTPEERLRHAFSTEGPNDMLAPDGPPHRELPPPSSPDYHWGSAREEQVRQPQIVVVGVG